MMKTKIVRDEIKIFIWDLTPQVELPLKEIRFMILTFENWMNFELCIIAKNKETCLDLSLEYWTDQ